MEGEKTDSEFWDGRWTDGGGKLLMRGDSQVSDAIFDYCDPYLKEKSGGRILEIGGAPGRYLGKFAKDYNLFPVAIDYSPVGCRQLVDNFQALGMEIEVIERDVLHSTAAETEKADIVISLGLIEHFEDPKPLIRKHLEYLKPDGYLILGVPNYSGIYEWFWRKLSPKLLSTHVLQTMQIEEWFGWQESCSMKAIDVNYVGGFDVMALDKNEVNKMGCRKILAGVLRKLFRGRNTLKGMNNRLTAGYLIGVFQLKESSE